MDEKIFENCNDLLIKMQSLKEFMSFDSLSKNRIQLNFFDVYREKMETVNVEKFELILKSLIDGKISLSLISNLEDLMFEILVIINNKEKEIFNYFFYNHFEHAIYDEKKYDNNLNTIRQLEQLVKEYNHIHEKNALEVYRENQKDYNIYKINYYDYYKNLFENYLEKFHEYSDRKNIFNEKLLDDILDIVVDYDVFSTNKISILKKTFNLNKVSIEINPKKKFTLTCL